MLQLPFSCYCSELKVNPKNWETLKANIKKDWFIYYRFYDPNCFSESKSSKSKLVVIKGMNHFKTVTERQNITKQIISHELDKLKIRGYNPITGRESCVTVNPNEISPNTHFLKALELAEKQITCTSSTKRDLKSIIRQVAFVSEILRYTAIPIKSITRKHVKIILQQIDVDLGASAYRYNKIRGYLMILFKELVEMDAIDFNPARDISKKKTLTKLRELADEKTRVVINNHLHANHYRFWLFMQIFFHSGARLTEIMLVQAKDVNLTKQTFKITIKKGANFKEVMKPIKDVALIYWQEVMLEAAQEDYIFSNGLMPGRKSIKSYQITKRWYRLVKQKLGVTVDFYSLKHLNLDQTAALLSIEDAAAMASHSNTDVTKKHYAINETNRQNERLKRVNNKFV